VLAFLQPVFSAFSPTLAAWSPVHGHVYRTGVPVPHSHPGDRLGSSHGAAAAEYGRTHENAVGEEPAAATDDAASDVGFTSAGASITSFLIAPTSVALTCYLALLPCVDVPLVKPTGIMSSPNTPPPQL